MRRLWLYFAAALCPVLATSLTSSSVSDDLVTQLNAVGNANTTDENYRNETDSSSNVPVKLLSNKVVYPDANANGTTNSVISFQQSGFTFIGRTTANTNLRPDQASAAAAVRNIAIFALNKRPAGQVKLDFGPMYNFRIKASFTFTRSTTTWTKEGLMEALMALEQYFVAHPSTQCFEISISSADGRRCAIRFTNVRVEDTTFQYDEPVIRQRSNRVTAYLWTGEELNRQNADVAILGAISWIDSHPPRALIDPGTVRTFQAGDLDLSMAGSDLSRGTADITWRQLGVGLRALFQQVAQFVGEDRDVVVLAIFEDYRQRRQFGVNLKKNSAVFISSTGNDIGNFSSIQDLA